MLIFSNAKEVHKLKKRVEKEMLLFFWLKKNLDKSILGSKKKEALLPEILLQKCKLK